MAFQYTLALYPFLPFGVVFFCNVLRLRYQICTRRICSCGRYGGKGSFFNAAVAFFLLSYTKILFVSISLLLPTHVYDIKGMTMEQCCFMTQPLHTTT